MADTDTEAVRREFWIQVVIFNVALLGLAAGAMLIGFRGEWLAGGALLAAGALSFANGYRRYRAVTGRNG